MTSRALLFGALLVAMLAHPAFAACQFLKVASPTALVENNRLYLPGRLNGQDILFFVDTGAQISLILPAGAKKLGLNVLTTQGHLMGATGHPVQLYRARIESISLGDWVGRDFDLMVAGDGENFGHERAVLLLGADFLRQFDIEMDLTAGIVNLFKPQGCEDAKLAYWTDRDNEADMIGSYTDSGHVLLHPKVNDVELTAMLDSGASLSVLTDSAASRAGGFGPDSPGVTAAGPVAGIGGVKAQSWLATFAGFTLDQEVIKPAKLRFFQFGRAESDLRNHIDSSMEEIDMLLGLDFIHAHHILISNSQRKVYFTYSGGAPFEKTWPRSGNWEASATGR